ncbi:homologous-pairing protein 2 homolog isoform X3 [Ovis aries]|uniref:homologous-pairing protein 2 homolog isoform X3 n=1 Tax=Ovis aries TaxID=9940 RepID=UPI002952603E|nr:homologous-pairing protein 2 homolog isoform X3 [Ovis aries]
MSKGRLEAAAGGNSRGRWETGRRVGRGRLKDPLPALSLRSLRDPAEVPTGAEPALQCPGRIREPAAGTWAGQDGGGEGAGAAGPTRQNQREDVWQAEDILCGPELKELTSALTTPEMQKEIQELKKECAGYRERLKNIKAATNHVTPEEKEQVYKERQRYHKEWRRRKRMATELSDAILEGYPKSKKQFFVSGACPPLLPWDFDPRWSHSLVSLPHRRKLG